MIGVYAWTNRKAILTVVLLLCIIGAISAKKLPVAIFPQLTVPRIAVSADAGDLPIDSTLSQVTRPLESAVSTVIGVRKVKSTTTRGSVDLDISFAWGTDMELALQHVQQKLAQSRGSLPNSTLVNAAAINPSLFPILGYSLTSDTKSIADLRKMALYTLRPRLARLPGVAQVRVTGGEDPEFVVKVRAEALSSRGLSMQDVIDAVSKSNSVNSVGVFDKSYQRYEVLVSGLLHSKEDLQNVTVATKSGVAIPISDLATVTDGTAPRTLIATGNGKMGVLLNIVKQPNANTVAVADEVKVELNKDLRELPPGVNSNLFYDQSDIVKASESSVIESIVIGGILALIVLLFFLNNLRAAIVVLSILPASLLLTCWVMSLVGQTLNIMTLGAMAITLGLVIDDGIVVVETIVQAMETGLGRWEAITSGLKGISGAMVGSSITTMLAFIPLTLLSGVTGQFFAPLAFVMVTTLAISLVLVMTVGPILAGFLLTKTHAKHVARVGRRFNPFGRLRHWIDEIPTRFGRLLRWSLAHPYPFLVSIVPILFVTVFTFNHLATGFFPEFDEGAFVIDYKLPAGTSLTETDRVCRIVEKILGNTPEVASWSRLTGGLSGSGFELAEQNEGDILVRLKAQRSRSADEIMNSIRTTAATEAPSFNSDFVQVLQDSIGDMAGSPKPIEIKLFGKDMTTLAAVAKNCATAMSKLHWIVDENTGVVQVGPEVEVRVDPQQASRFGLTTDAVTQAATAAVRGTVATSIQNGEAPVDVRVRAVNSLADVNTQDLGNLPIPSPTLTSSSSAIHGDTIPLSSLAAITTQPGALQVTRENQEMMVPVTARLNGRDLGSGVRDVNTLIKNSVSFPPGTRYEIGGLYSSQQKSFADLAGVLALAVILVFGALLVQFRSFKQSIVLLAAAALSMVGVLLGLLITRVPLNISSFTGAIMIVGIVTENGIVFFSQYNQMKQADDQTSDRELLIAAGIGRVRPIMMTTIGAILVLFPLALGIGAGAAMQKPLAVAVIGGLCVSMFFTLLIGPVLFLTLSEMQDKVSSWRGRLVNAKHAQ